MTVKRSYTFTVSEQYDGFRVDKYISENLSDLSRSSFSTDLSEIYVNSNLVKKSYHVKAGQNVVLNYVSNVFSGIIAQDIMLNIIYEDEHILVINKEQGMVVHPGNGVNDGTLVNALAYRYGENFINSFNEEYILRPGIVHRLDKDTSGVMVISLNMQSLNKLSSDFSHHRIEKYYYALCDGSFINKSGKIEGFITRNPQNRKTFILTENKGRYSCTEYVVENEYEDFSLLKLKLLTGRTHQIRVHLKSINHSIIGDMLYNPHYKRYSDSTLMLHSYSLTFRHPVSNKKMIFRADIPERFNNFINNHLLNSEKKAIF